MTDQSESTEEAILRDRLVRTWARIEPYTGTASPHWESATAPLSQQQRIMLSRWLTLFEDELRLVRGARNEVVASPKGLSKDSLEGAVEVASELYRLLQEGLSNPVAPQAIGNW